MTLRRFLFLIFACVALGPPLLAQNVQKAFQLTALNQCAAIGTANQATVGIQVSGTWSATLQPQVSIGGGSATNTTVTPTGSTTAQGTIAANGVFTSSVAGMDLFQVCVSAYTSGTATVVLTISQAVNAQLFGGASGSGTLTGLIVQNNGVSQGTVPAGTPILNFVSGCTSGALAGATFSITCSGGGGTTTNALTMNNGGSGGASGTTFNGASAVTLSYNTLGAAPLASPTFTGTVTIPTLATATIAGAPTFSGNLTFSGTNAYGTPTSITLTNATGLPISTGLTGAGTGVLAALANATNAASGLVTFSGALGTPTAGTVTNLTGTCTNCGSNTVDTAVSSTNASYSILTGSATSGQQEPSTVASFTINPSTGAMNVPGVLTVSSCTGCGGGGSGTVSSSTIGYVPMYTAATTVGTSSPLLDIGVTTANTLTFAGSAGITASAGPLTSGVPAGGVGSSLFMKQEGTVPGSLSTVGQDNCYADSTQHGLLCNFNAGTTLPITQGPASDTSGHLATWSGTNGGKLVDGGAVPTGTVTSIATTAPLGGGTITTSGTLTCTTCVTSAASLATGGVVLGTAGTQASATNTQLVFSGSTLTVGLAGTGTGIVALGGATSGTATMTGPAVAGTLTNPIAFSNAISTGTAPAITTIGNAFAVFGTEGTEPVSIAATTDGFNFDSTSHCPVQWNNATNVGCSAALGATESFTAVQTFTGNETIFTPAAKASGVVPYFQINTPTDTGLTAATEAPGFQTVTGTRTWATTGTVATQREYLFVAPTYASASASQTFTKAATVAVSAAPIAGSNAIITNPYAFWVQAGQTEVDGALAATSTTALGSTGQLAVSTAGIATKYNNISTVNNGVGSEVATVDSSNSATVTATTLYTPTATGRFKISANLIVTTAATTSSILGGTTGVVITYTDGTSSVAQSVTCYAVNQSAAIITIGTGNTGNTTTSQYNCVPMYIFAKTGVAIQYAIGYTSVGGTAMVYEAHLLAESM